MKLQNGVVDFRYSLRRARWISCGKCDGDPSSLTRAMWIAAGAPERIGAGVRSMACRRPATKKPIRADYFIGLKNTFLSSLRLFRAFSGHVLKGACVHAAVSAMTSLQTFDNQLLPTTESFLLTYK